MTRKELYTVAVRIKYDLISYKEILRRVEYDYILDELEDEDNLDYYASEVFLNCDYIEEV